MAPSKITAQAWAEKRRQQVEAAIAKKAQKELGEVTSDHTFKPKLRKRPGQTSSASVKTVESEKCESETKAAAPKRRPGDATPEVRVEEKVSRRPIDRPMERPIAQAQAHERSPTARRPASGQLGGSAERKASPSVSSLEARQRGGSVTSIASVSGTSVSSAASRGASPRQAKRKAQRPERQEKDGLFCWKDVAKVLRDPPGQSRQTSRGFDSELSEAAGDDVSLDGQSQFTSLALDEEDDLEKHIRLERMRQQLEEQQRQLEEQALLLQRRELDASQLQQLDLERRERLDRFDREHQMELPCASELQEAQPNAKPALPAITENALAETSEIADAPDLKSELEELQAQQLAEMQLLQQQWKQEQDRLQQKLQQQLMQFQLPHEGPALPTLPESQEATPEAVQEPKQETAAASTEAELKALEVDAPQAPPPEVRREVAPEKRALAAQLDVMLAALQKSERSSWQCAAEQQQDLLQRITQLGIKCQQVESRIKDSALEQESPKADGSSLQGEAMVRLQAVADGLRRLMVSRGPVLSHGREELPHSEKSREAEPVLDAQERPRRWPPGPPLRAVREEL